MRALAIIAMLPAAATIYFAAFWTWFPFWRRHPVLTYSFMFSVIGGLAATLIVLRESVLAYVIEMPAPVVAIGWLLVAISFSFGMIADRQLGFRIRSFAPFFEEGATIELCTTGAYGVVRHPIYASGVWFQLGVLLATGYAAVAVALAAFWLGALWFTRQEERRLVELLADPSAYDRYRERVGRLFPRPRRRPR